MEQTKQRFWDHPMKLRTTLYICAAFLLAIIALLVTIKVVCFKSGIAINNIIMQSASAKGESIAKTIALFAADDISAHNYRTLQTRFTAISRETGLSYITLVRENSSITSVVSGARETGLSYITLVRVSDNRAVVHTDPKLTAKVLDSKEDHIAASSQTILTTQNIRDKKVMDIALRIQTVSESFVLRVGVPY